MASALPPVSGTRRIDPSLDANRMTPRPQVAPPRSFLPFASARSLAGPPPIPTRFNLPEVKNPMDWLSGDQNGSTPASVSPSRDLQRGEVTNEQPHLPLYQATQDDVLTIR